jgi:ligand-binding SRPBCC domain-containing protein
MGEMAEIVLGSARVSPARLKAQGFTWLYPTLPQALGQICAHYPDQVFERHQFIERPIAEVFDFFSQAKNLELLTPPWLNFLVTEQSSETLGTGTEIEYKLRLHGLPIRWRSRLENWEQNKSFVDTQIKGPYLKWHHLHKFKSLRSGTLVTDRVTYRLRFGQFGALVAGSFVENDVKQIFSYRSNKLRELFTREKFKTI